MSTSSSAPTVEIIVDGCPARVAGGITVAAALMNIGLRSTRTSVSGAGRMAVCGMGICFECRVTIDDVPHRRGCMTLVADRMRIATVPGSEDAPRA